MAVTIKEIAAELGLSVATVSKALADYPDVAPATRQLVKETARRMGYWPSAAARSLRTRRTDTIGLVFCIMDRHLTDPYYLDLLASIGEECARHGFDLLLSACPDRERERSAYDRMVGGKRVDGMILTGTRHHDERIVYLLEQEVPFVAFGRLDDDGEFPYVDVDGTKAVRDGVQHLIEQGYRRIGFIGLPQELVCAGHRFQGYKAALEENGLALDPHLVLYCERLTQEAGYRAMQRLLALNEPLDAAFVCSDVMALGAMKAVQEQGLTVGKDFGIVGFDDIPMAAQVQPSLSSIRQPIYEVGVLLCRMLIRLIQGEPLPQPHVLLEPTLVVRESSRRRE
jgi:DNA-binding LacI/PurR family transcriptional regulator